MLNKLKESWQQFKDAEPGPRFEERYEPRQRESEGKFSLGKILNIVFGLAIAVVGIILIPAPGPGAIIVFVGLGLIGSEFLPIARALDRTEVRLRAIQEWAQEVWKRLPLPVKMLIILFLAVCAAAAAYTAHQYYLGNSGSAGQQPPK